MTFPRVNAGVGFATSAFLAAWVSGESKPRERRECRCLCRRYLSNQEGHAAKIEFLLARAAASCAHMGRAPGCSSRRGPSAVLAVTEPQGLHPTTARPPLARASRTPLPDPLRRAPSPLASPGTPNHPGVSCSFWGHFCASGPRGESGRVGCARSPGSPLLGKRHPAPHRHVQPGGRLGGFSGQARPPGLGFS